MKPEILIVEDEDAVREIIAAGLQAGGYRTLAVTDGRSMEQVLAHHAAPGELLVLMDIALQNENGVDLAVASAKRFGLTRFLFISAYVDNVLMLHSAIDGAHVGFLRKPFTHAELLDAVADMERQGV